MIYQMKTFFHNNMATIKLQQALDYAKQNPDSDFSSQLRTMIETGKLDNSASQQGVDISRFPRKESSVEPKQTPPTFLSRVKEAAGDFTGIGNDIAESSEKRADNISTIQTARDSGEQSGVRSAFQTAGQLAGAGADAIGAVFKGGANMLLSDKTEKDVTDVITKFGAKVMANPDVQGIVNKYNNLSPEQQRDIDAVGGIVSLVGEFIGVGVAKRSATVVKEGIDLGIDATKRGIDATTDAITSGAKSVADSGVGQITSDLASRVPRAIGRAKDNLAEAGIRAERMRTATPAVKNAMKSNLDERIINTINDSDDATRKAFSDVLAIAEESPTKIGTKRQPTIVGGELASQQFDLVNKQKKATGQALGDLTKTLSKTEQVNMQESFGQIDDILSNQGILPQYTKKGVKLDFTGSKYTPAERTRIQELYKLAIEGGDTLTPLQIREKDQLFSKLKREANFEGVGNIIIETPDGTSSMFDVFRDIYSNKLDTISPELRNLNSQYRKSAQLVEDIEDSIFKTPNFNVTKTADPAEFAKVNLRRIFGESQSSPAFEAVADAMDASARGLGYKGATPKEVALFAQEMRKLFPETIPKTGFTGGIRAGLGDIVEAVSKAGAPNITDQQKAVRELINSYLTNKKKTIIPKNTPKAPISATKSQMSKPSAKNAPKNDIPIVSTKPAPKSSLKGQGETPKTNSAKEAVAKGMTEDEFVKSITERDGYGDGILVHATNVDIKNNTLSFGAGEGAKKGGQSGGHFFTDSTQFADVFGKNKYYADKSFKNNVLDLSSTMEWNKIRNQIGKTYKSYEGEMITFTKQDYDSIFPNGKNPDFATIAQYGDFFEDVIPKIGYDGIAFPEFAGGKTAKTYQFYTDNIPVKTTSQLRKEFADALKASKSKLPPKKQ